MNESQKISDEPKSGVPVGSSAWLGGILEVPEWGCSIPYIVRRIRRDGTPPPSDRDVAQSGQPPSVAGSSESGHALRENESDEELLKRAAEYDKQAGTLLEHAKEIRQYVSKRETMAA